MCIVCGVKECHFKSSSFHPACRRDATHKAILEVLDQCERGVPGIKIYNLGNRFYERKYNAISFTCGEIDFGVCVPEDIMNNRGPEMNEPENPTRCQIYVSGQHIKTNNICDLVPYLKKYIARNLSTEVLHSTAVALSSTAVSLSSTAVSLSSTEVALSSTEVSHSTEVLHSTEVALSSEVSHSTEVSHSSTEVSLSSTEVSLSHDIDLMRVQLSVTTQSLNEALEEIKKLKGVL
jgi:hypothetical protein